MRKLSAVLAVCSATLAIPGVANAEKQEIFIDAGGDTCGLVGTWWDGPVEYNVYLCHPQFEDAPVSDEEVCLSPSRDSSSPRRVAV